MRGSLETGLMYERKDITEVKVERCVDSDYAGYLDSRKSLTGYIFTIYGGAMSWKSSLQSVVALSTTEAEYMAIIEAIKEAIWMKG